MLTSKSNKRRIFWRNRCTTFWVVLYTSYNWRR